MKRPQLILRDLFWILLVVGLGAGWWTDRVARHNLLDDA